MAEAIEIYVAINMLIATAAAILVWFIISP
jgi:hypothetical protein